MSIIKWDESLTVGVKSIDDQHKQLINMINELHLAVEYGKSRDVILPVIDRLQEYVGTHFLAEERLFSEIGYQGMAEHRQEHLDFVRKIESLSRQFSYNQDFLAIHIKDLLLTWFYNHLRTKDMEYKHLIG
jgi:hemerythrin